MKNKFHIIVILIIILSAIITSLGLFYNTNGKSYDVLNQYGDQVKIFGDGIYKHDSFFMATIFKGTDFTILFIAIPLLIVALFWDIKKQNIKSSLFLISILSIFTYYSISISFGVTYNILHLLYIALFGLCFFGFIYGLYNIQKNARIVFENNINFETNGLNSFLVVAGVSLFAAWMPDIVISLNNKKPLILIEVYTTQITYVLDMGIISPACFICLYLIKKQKDFGIILLAIILTLFSFVGIMIPIQTIFQYYYGITLPAKELIIKVGIFIILAVISIYYYIKLFKKIPINN